MRTWRLYVASPGESNTALLGQCWEHLVSTLGTTMRSGAEVRLEFPMGTLVCEEGVSEFIADQHIIDKIKSHGPPHRQSKYYPFDLSQITY